MTGMGEIGEGELNCEKKGNGGIKKRLGANIHFLFGSAQSRPIKIGGALSPFFGRTNQSVPGKSLQQSLKPFSGPKFAAPLAQSTLYSFAFGLFVLFFAHSKTKMATERAKAINCVLWNGWDGGLCFVATVLGCALATLFFILATIFIQFHGIFRRRPQKRPVARSIHPSILLRSRSISTNARGKRVWIGSNKFGIKFWKIWMKAFYEMKEGIKLLEMGETNKQ